MGRGSIGSGARSIVGAERGSEEDTALKCGVISVSREAASSGSLYVAAVIPERAPARMREAELNDDESCAVGRPVMKAVAAVCVVTGRLLITRGAGFALNHHVRKVPAEKLVLFFS